MNDNFMNINKAIEIYSKNITEYTSPLKEYFSHYLIDDNIYNIINCSFLAEDLKYIYIHINENLAPTSIKIGSIIVSLAFINSINVIFLLIIILRNIKPKKSILKRHSQHTIQIDINLDPQINYKEISPNDQTNRINQMEMSHFNLDQ